MTGRIKSLSALRRSGFIKSDSGLNLYFESSQVRPRGATGLVAGQLVTFDLDGNKWPTALNVRVKAQSPAAPGAPQVGSAGAGLQYMGFEQKGRIRAYRFKRVLRGQETREFTVSADMALFVKHHVGIQEGPALSLRLLSAVPDGSAPAAWPPSHSLSDVEMLAHLARRAAAGSIRRRKNYLDVQAPLPGHRVQSARAWNTA
jgi:cold shock CspA family protein